MIEDKRIEGLVPREPIGACVTIGIKGKSGFPTQRDRWHIVVPREAEGIRAYHPAFHAFNTAPPDQRKMLRGNIIHARREQCFEHYLRAQFLKSAHPNRRPACQGNGIVAMRWEGGDPEQFMEIKCPNDQCEYRLTAPPKCKPFMRLLFRLRWKDNSPMPTPLVKFTSGSWNTTSNFLGLFGYLETAAQELGIQDYSLFGYPFSMTLIEQTKRSSKTRFPVVVVSGDMDPVQFFKQQREWIREIGEQVPVKITDAEQQHALITHEDHKQISVPGGTHGAQIDNP